MGEQLLDQPQPTPQEIANRVSLLHLHILNRDEESMRGATETMLQASYSQTREGETLANLARKLQAGFLERVLCLYKYNGHLSVVELSKYKEKGVCFVSQTGLEMLSVIQRSAPESIFFVTYPGNRDMLSENLRRYSICQIEPIRVIGNDLEIRKGSEISEGVLRALSHSGRLDIEKGFIAKDTVGSVVIADQIKQAQIICRDTWNMDEEVPQGIVLLDRVLPVSIENSSPVLFMPVSASRNNVSGIVFVQRNDEVHMFSHTLELNEGEYNVIGIYKPLGTIKDIAREVVLELPKIELKRIGCSLLGKVLERWVLVRRRRMMNVELYDVKLDGCDMGDISSVEARLKQEGYRRVPYDSTLDQELLGASPTLAAFESVVLVYGDWKSYQVTRAHPYVSSEVVYALTILRQIKREEAFYMVKEKK